MSAVVDEFVRFIEARVCERVGRHLRDRAQRFMELEQPRESLIANALLNAAMEIERGVCRL